eukprot:1392095-Amorphochlora_amoeboformis.AAC.1
MISIHQHSCDTTELSCTVVNTHVHFAWQCMRSCGRQHMFPRLKSNTPEGMFIGPDAATEAYEADVQMKRTCKIVYTRAP